MADESCLDSEALRGSGMVLLLLLLLLRDLFMLILVRGGGMRVEVEGWGFGQEACRTFWSARAISSYR